MKPLTLNSKAKSKTKSRVLKSKKHHLIKKPVTITKEKLDETINDIQKEIKWGNQYSERICSVLIHQISPNARQSYQNSVFLLLEEARLCVLQRDWKNLAHILTIAKPSNREHHLLFPVLMRYAMICLAHNPDKKLMDVFLSGVAGCSSQKEKQMLLNSIMRN